jgi:hypothetical protein
MSSKKWYVHCRVLYSRDISEGDVNHGLSKGPKRVRGRTAKRRAHVERWFISRPLL